MDEIKEVGEIRETICKLLVDFENARRSILLVSGFSAVNLFLSIIKANLYFLFSATIPQYIYAFGEAYSDLYSENYYIIGIALAIFVILLYLVCWYFSIKWRFLMPLISVFFILDCALMAFVFFSVDFDLGYIIDIIFHGYILISLISGSMAWYRLRQYSSAELQLYQGGIALLDSSDDD